jgi:hypothetical protein
MTMKSFKRFLRDQSSGFVIYHYDTDDAEARKLIQEVLTEEKKSVELGRGKSIVHHKAHIPDGQDHLHFQVKGSNVYAVNKDGTAHDRSHGKQMQRWTLDGAALHYPGFKMPKDGLTEEILANGKAELLTESGHEPAVLISKAWLTKALSAATKAG